eukprot:snap_masked-scaffold_6-processed-gene-3.32-mRNA-1 protein AED:1.00 eAED:1.00 QI:0/0/0/0/1/1/2/0/702
MLGFVPTLSKEDSTYNFYLAPSFTQQGHQMWYTIHSHRRRFMELILTESEEPIPPSLEPFIPKIEEGKQVKLSPRSDEYKRNILHIALEARKILVAKQIINLLYQNEYAKNMLAKKVLNQETSLGVSVVHILSFLGESELLEKVLNHPEFDHQGLNQQVQEKYSPLVLGFLFERVNIVEVLLSYEVDVDFVFGDQELTVFHLIPYLNSHGAEAEREDKLIRIFDSILNKLKNITTEERNELLTARTDADEDFVYACAFFTCMKLFLHLKSIGLLSLFDLNTVDSAIFHCLVTSCCESTICFESKYDFVREILSLDQFNSQETTYYGMNLFGFFIDRIDSNRIEEVWCMFDLVVQSDLSIWDIFIEDKKTNTVEFIISRHGKNVLKLFDKSIKHIEPNWFNHISLGSSPLDFACFDYLKSKFYTPDSIIKKKDLDEALSSRSFQNVKYLLRKGSKLSINLETDNFQISALYHYQSDYYQSSYDLLLLDHLFNTVENKMEMISYNNYGNLSLAFSAVRSWNSSFFNLILDNSDSKLSTLKIRSLPCCSKSPHRLLITKNVEQGFNLKKKSWLNTFRDTHSFHDYSFCCRLCRRRIPIEEKVLVCEHPNCRSLYCEHCLFLSGKSRYINLVEYSEKTNLNTKVRVMNKLLYLKSSPGKEVIDSEYDYGSTSSAFDIYQAAGLTNFSRNMLENVIPNEMQVFDFAI